MEEVNLKDLDNKDLVDRIRDFNSEQLIRVKEAAILNAMYSLNTIEDRLKIRKLGQDPVGEEAEELRALAEELREILLEPREARLGEIRDNLYSKKVALDGYISELNYLGEKVNERGFEIVASQHQAVRRPVESILMQLDKALEESSQDYPRYVTIVGEIIKILPMRMLRKNYYTVIKESLKRNLAAYEKNQLELMVENYKRQFDSTIRNGYGLEFDHYFMLIRGIKERDLSKYGIEEMTELVEDMNGYMNELGVLKELVVLMGIVTNMIMVKILTPTIDLDLGEDLRKWQEAKSTEDKDLKREYGEDLNLRVQNMERSIEERLAYYEALTLETAQREDLDYGEINESLEEAARVLSYFNDLSFLPSDYVSLYRPDFPNLEDIENAIDGLIAYIDRAMKGMANEDRKLRMRRLLANIDLPFMELDEFKAYIVYALDERLTDPKILNIKMEQISRLLASIK